MNDAQIRRVQLRADGAKLRARTAPLPVRAGETIVDAGRYETSQCGS